MRNVVRLQPSTPKGDEFEGDYTADINGEYVAFICVHNPRGEPDDKFRVVMNSQEIVPPFDSIGSAIDYIVKENSR